MSNCLFEAAFEQILKDCKCAPGFHNEGGADAMEVSEAVSWQVVTLSDVTQHFQTYEVCTGAQLACSNEILNRMGQYNQGTVIENKLRKLFDNPIFPIVFFSQLNISFPISAW